MPILGRLRDRRALQPLLSVLADERSAEALQAAISALGDLGDPTAIGAVLSHAKHKEWPVRHAVRSSLLALAQPETVDQVRTVFISLTNANSYEHWHLRSLLRELEQRFPGK